MAKLRTAIIVFLREKLNRKFRRNKGFGKNFATAPMKRQGLYGSTIKYEMKREESAGRKWVTWEKHSTAGERKSQKVWKPCSDQDANENINSTFICWWWTENLHLSYDKEKANIFCWFFSVLISQKLRIYKCHWLRYQIYQFGKESSYLRKFWRKN